MTRPCQILGYQILVLGAGNAGLAAARVARAAGRSVAVVEGRAVGGTCPLRGCVPKKVLVAAAQALDVIDHASVHHIEVEGRRLDWARLIAREQSFTEGVSERFEAGLAERGIDLVKGRARFVDRRRVAVEDEVFEAEHIVIATGSVPRRLPFAGAEHLLTSDDLLTMRELPRSLAFVGGGVIALEFAHVLARAGTRVTVLEVAPRLLPALDEEPVAALTHATEAIGVEVMTGVEVKQVTAEGTGFEIGFVREQRAQALAVERVVNGAGRVADVEALDLDAGGIEHEGAKIALDEGLRSVSNPAVYAAGDAVSGSAQLSPLASYEGRLVGERIVSGEARAPDYRPVPSVVFTVPALASVGLTEAEARERGLELEVKTTDMHEWLAAKLEGGGAACAKVLLEKGSGRLLGAHLLGKRAEELIHLFALAMRLGATGDALGSMVYAFPTSSSEVAHLV